MTKQAENKIGIVIYLDPEQNLRLEQMVLDWKKEGIKVTKSELAAKLFESGYWKELQSGTRIGL